MYAQEVGIYLHVLCGKEYLDGNEMFLVQILFNNSIFFLYTNISNKLYTITLQFSMEM